MELAEIEIIKHTASWCNTVGNAVITTGFLAPIVALIIGLTAPVNNLGFMLLTNGGALILGVSLHKFGAAFLNEIVA